MRASHIADPPIAWSTLTVAHEVRAEPSAGRQTAATVPPHAEEPPPRRAGPRTRDPGFAFVLVGGRSVVGLAREAAE